MFPKDLKPQPVKLVSTYLKWCKCFDVHHMYVPVHVIMISQLNRADRTSKLIFSNILQEKNLNYNFEKKL